MASFVKNQEVPDSNRWALCATRPLTRLTFDHARVVLKSPLRWYAAGSGCRLADLVGAQPTERTARRRGQDVAVMCGS
ncbi:hypothetical protein VPNG_01131 [Cytospora leucostoma]|uniref:Uncharacterized protein n=1 Tax=Cytospora leucostoma TaxID=1230097 RepID=A0A423XLI0_9PEZI|nr:hypothetical protein VPNG_01131 [Cytospora leucostoma]